MDRMDRKTVLGATLRIVQVNEQAMIVASNEFYFFIGLARTIEQHGSAFHNQKAIIADIFSATRCPRGREFDTIVSVSKNPEW